MNPEQVYRQICIPAPDSGLTGPVLVEWIERIAAVLGLEWVAITDVDITPDRAPHLSLPAADMRVMPVAALSSRLGTATQVVWGTFFFGQDSSQVGLIRADETYHDSTMKAEVVLRAVDATYVYVIGPIENLLRLQLTLSAEAEVHDGSIHEMEFPE